VKAKTGNVILETSGKKGGGSLKNMPDFLEKCIIWEVKSPGSLTWSKGTTIIDRWVGVCRGERRSKKDDNANKGHWPWTPLPTKRANVSSPAEKKGAA